MTSKDTHTHVLVVDDEENIVEVVQNALKTQGFEVSTTTDSAQATSLIENNDFDLVITDLKMSPVDGMAILRRCKEKDPHTQVLMMTAFASVETAVDAMKSGAYDYIIKPFKLSELKLVVQRALEYRSTRIENRQLRTLLKKECDLSNVIGESPAMRRVFDRVEKIAGSDATVLITGESGTGKEMIARAIFMNSQRKDAPFVTINCGALTETLLESELFGHKKGSFTGATSDKIGLFQEADGGTLFLDEVGLMSVGLQMKLLRVLQEQEIRRVGDTKDIKVNVRIITATNDDLMQKVKDGEFREDLYYRLNVIPIMLPPLRERKSDIPLLVEHFLTIMRGTSGKRVHVESSFMDSLQRYSWPGNVRELRNVIERACALSDEDTLRVKDLPEAVQEENHGDANRDLRSTIEDTERNHIQRILLETDGNKKLAARILNIDLATLYRKIDKLDISLDDL